MGWCAFGVGTFAVEVLAGDRHRISELLIIEVGLLEDVSNGEVGAAMLLGCYLAR